MDNMRARGRGRRGRVRGRAATRRKKSADRKEDLAQSPGEEEDEVITPSDDSPQVTESPPQPIVPPPLDMEADISQLEAPTFTTLSRGPPEPMLRLDWGHAVKLIGEKVLNPMIHCCDTCLRPILIYGRMIPCKHVFCLECAHRDSKQCPRCNDKVLRVEQTGLGTVFMCNHGGSRYGNNGCRRTYLSQRDLQAHINHRHVVTAPTAAGKAGKVSSTPALVQPQSSVAPNAYYQPPKGKLYEDDDNGFGLGRTLADSTSPVAQLPILRPSGNLITVAIQDPPTEPYFKGFHQPPPSVPPPNLAPPSMAQQHLPYFPPASFDYPPPDTSVPPPTQWPGSQQFY